MPAAVMATAVPKACEPLGAVRVDVLAHEVMAEPDSDAV